MTPCTAIQGPNKCRFSARSPSEPLCVQWNIDAVFLLTVGSFLLTVELFYLQVTRLVYLQLELFCFDNFSFFAYNWSFCAYSGKVRLIRALRDYKQRSSTVSKQAPTVSGKASPNSFSFVQRGPGEK